MYGMGIDVTVFSDKKVRPSCIISYSLHLAGFFVVVCFHCGMRGPHVAVPRTVNPSPLPASAPV